MAGRGINKVILIGHLGKDPEIRYTFNNNPITNFSIATSEVWKDKQTGEQQTKTEWHRIVAFGKLAEIAGEYLRKGSLVYIEGSLQTRKWQDQNGQDRYVTEVIVNIGGKLQILSSAENNDTNVLTGQKSAKNSASASNDPLPEFDDDIPF